MTQSTIERDVLTRASARTRTRTRALVREIVAGAFAPRTRLTVDQWADRHRILDIRSSGAPGRWQTARTPYLRGIMRSWTDPTCERIVVQKSSQLGMTEAAINCLLFAIASDPGPIMVGMPSREMARDWNRDRFTPAVKATPETARRLGDSVDDEAGARLRFDQSVVYFVGTGSTAAMRSKPIRYRVLDDAEVCGPGAIEELDQRGLTFRDCGGKFLVASVPGWTDTGIDAEYARSDRRRYEVPCPHNGCKNYFELAWERVRWKGGIKAGSDDIAAAWIECPHCRGKLSEQDRIRAVGRGVWLRAGERLIRRDGASKPGPEQDADGRTEARPGSTRVTCTGEPVPDGYVLVGAATRPGSTHGYRMELVSPFVSIATLVGQFVGYRGSPPREWWNGQIGRAWQAEGDRVDVGDIRKLARPVVDGGYLLGTVPRGVVWLLGTIDVQSDHVWMQVTGVGERGDDYWLIDFVQVPSLEGDGLSRAKATLGKIYEGADGMRRRCQVWGVDTGYGRRTAETYRFVKSEPRARACKGQDSAASVLPWRCTVLERYPDGKPLVGGLRLYTLNVGLWKTALFGALRVPVEEASGLEGSDAGAGTSAAASRVRWHVPEDAPLDWMQQLTAESLRETKTAGKVTYRWELRTGRTDNHAIDLCYMAMAMADVHGARDITAADIGRFAMRVERAGAGAGTTGATKGHAAGGGNTTGITAVNNLSQWRRS